MTSANMSNLSAMPITATDSPIFDKEKHISYWMRCLRSYLPHHYTSNDSNRVALAFFIISALDLLDVLRLRTTPQERAAWIDWVYSCQSPSGGFCGSPIITSQDVEGRQCRAWSPATVPSTYFALGSLCILRDDLRRVKRGECLSWLTKVQRVEDGSFGELLSETGRIEGGWDSRYGYCAMVVRWILRGHLEGEVEGVPDVNVESLAQCVRQSENYNGGLSDRPFHEAHAGFTYCGIGALSFLDRLDVKKPQTALASKDQVAEEAKIRSRYLSHHQKTIRWLLSLLTTFIEEDELEEGDELDSSSEFTSPDRTASTSEVSLQYREAPRANDTLTHFDTPSVTDSSFVKVRSTPASQAEATVATPIHSNIFDSPDPQFTAFSGRPNKIADTCYAFWAGGALKMLGSLDLIDVAPLQRYLLGKTQHLIAGGFGKTPGDPPDIYHSYLGLATLSMLFDEDGGNIAFAINTSGNELERPLLSLDASLCMSIKAKEWIESLELRNRQ